MASTSFAATPIAATPISTTAHSSSVPLPLRYGSAVKHALRRGDYRSFTFKLPAHYPELRLSVVCETGSVCLYASNCSARPDPRNCQWTLLVDSQKSKLGSLVVRTNEHHFVGGLYHVGLYSVTDSEFSIGCFPTPASASDKLRASTRQRQRTSPAAFSPRPQSRLHTKPFVDAGLLEELCAARGLLVGFGATAPPASSPPAPSSARPFTSFAGSLSASQQLPGAVRVARVRTPRSPPGVPLVGATLPRVS